MKTYNKKPASSEKTTPHQMKTALFLVDDKGGVGKSSNAAHLADSLLELGYKVRLADADPINRTLTQLIPDASPGPTVTRLDGNKPTEMVDYIIDTATAPEDVTIIDMPGSSSKILKKAKISLEEFRQAGIRVLIVIAVTENIDAVLGSREWLRDYGDRVDYFILANAKDCADDENFNSDRIPGLNAIIKKTGNRMSIIPKFSDMQLDNYKSCKSSPKGYMQGGWAAKRLGLNVVYSAWWQTHFLKTLATIEPHAEYLTGKPVPKPSALNQENDDSGMDDLCSKLDSLAP